MLQPGQIIVELNVSGPTSVYVAAAVYSSIQQDVLVVPRWTGTGSDPMAASGTGMGSEINNWTWELSETDNSFGLSFQYGPAGDASPTVNQYLSTTNTPGGCLNQLTVVSQNGGNNSDSCVVLFQWFS
jgi:hypothetical protein